jgi:hypothetical protein
MKFRFFSSIGLALMAILVAHVAQAKTLFIILISAEREDTSTVVAEIQGQKFYMHQWARRPIYTVADDEASARSWASKEAMVSFPRQDGWTNQRAATVVAIPREVLEKALQ